MLVLRKNTVKSFRFGSPASAYITRKLYPGAVDPVFLKAKRCGLVWLNEGILLPGNAVSKSLQYTPYF